MVRRAILIRDPEKRRCPQIYVDQILERIMEWETSWEEAAREVAGMFRRATHMNVRYESVPDSLDKEEVLRRVECQLVNTEWNRERLRTLAHREMLDLSVVYRIVLDEAAGIMVTDEVCSRHGISLEELDGAARRNTEQRGFRLCRMSEVIAEIAGVGHGDDNGPEIYLMTSTGGTNGAAVMLYPQCFDRLAQKIGSGLYIMPSSIHEVIAVPDTAAEPEHLRRIVEEINRTEVDEEEVLSGSVYRYSRRDRRITVAHGHGAAERTMGGIS